jgi:HlyD family secretion protein
MSAGKNADIHADGIATTPEIAGLPAVVKLPAVVPPAHKRPDNRHWLRPALLLLTILVAAISGGYWWLRPQGGLPASIASGNGRLEADEIDIDTKYAGRIDKLFADEGDLTKAGQVLVLMNTDDIAASLKKSQALVEQAQQTLNAATATLGQQKSQVVLAQQQIERARALVPDGFMTKQMLDQRQQVLDSAVSGQSAAGNVIGEAQYALDAARHDAEFYQAEIADNTLVSPRDGRIQYRVANVGEVLAAGGKVFTILDTAYVYMDIYLPTLQAGRIRLGSDARIVLDSYPGHAFPAKVVFVAAQAQFTPKTVETKDERDLLMFRIRVRIDPELLRAHAAEVRSGLPGVGYVQTDATGTWPIALQGDASK